MPQNIKIIQPDDFHLHIREGEIMNSVLPLTTQYFKRAIIMPNLKNPIITSTQAQKYKEQILTATQKHNPKTQFIPLMTTYLTDNTDHNDIYQAHKNNIITAVKMYPANSTTNSQYGLSDPLAPHKLYQTLQDNQIPLLIHGEVTNPKIDIYDREHIFIENILTKIINKYPKLKIILEHITTKQAVQFIQSHNHIAATITPHHLWINRSDMFKNSRINPHMFCLPIAKREIHRQELIKAATSGDKRFFAGTDSAPHTQSQKENSCGCAGIFNAPTAIQTYTEIFEQYNALPKLEAFLSKNGAEFYNLNQNPTHLQLTKNKNKIPQIIKINDTENIIPFRSGEEISWQCKIIN